DDRLRLGHPRLGPELEPDQGLVQAVNGRATEDAALAVEQRAVGSVGTQQLGHLFHEATEHRVELELAGHRLGCVEERLLLAETETILLEQVTRAKRRRELVRHRLEQELLARGERRIAL